jgi:antagonist of KipI
MSEIIEVITGGLFTTIQDLGRYGYQRYGVPVSGAMDTFSLRIANLLAGNEQHEAGLEITLVGPDLKFLDDTIIAITGGNLDPKLDGESIPLWQATIAQQGSILTFGGIKDGARAYLSVAGGIDVKPVLGSRSTYTRAKIGGFQGRQLSTGDVLSSSSTPSRIEGRFFPKSSLPKYGHSHKVDVILGPQESAFTEQGIATLFKSEYEITAQSDRIGYRLTGPTIQHKRGADIISDGIPFGAIQVTGDGLPIILMSDRGTTGGYTKIGTVISADIATIAQAAPGDIIQFNKTTVNSSLEKLMKEEDLIKTVASATPVFFSKQNFTVSLDNEQYLVETRLSVESTPSSKRNTIHAKVDGHSFSFNVKVEK